MHKIISSSSEGNAVLYFDSILIDCGIPYYLLKEYVGNIKLVLLTHSHGDHFNLKTIKKISLERPAVRFGCGKHLSDYLTDIRNVDIYEPGKIYDYGKFKISPVILYHDVLNFGYRIFIDGKKIFHATDTAHLKGITAKNYDIYSLECNYDEDTVWEHIEEKEKKGEFAHQRGAINSHLSIQQAQDFILNNADSGYEFLQLHQSKEF